MSSYLHEPYDPYFPSIPYKAIKLASSSSALNFSTLSSSNSYSSSPSTSTDNFRHPRDDSSNQLDEFRPLLAQAVHRDIGPERRSALSSHPWHSFPPSSSTTMSAYDERLLASAPAATRAEKQEGYNVDLLDNSRNAPKSGSASPTPAALAPNSDYAEAQYPKETPGAVLYSSHCQRPWYKTRKWIIIFTLLAIVVVAAVIGGAVGGTLGNKHKDNGNNSAQSDPNGGSTNPGESGADTGASGPQSGAQSGASVSASSGQTTTAATTPPETATAPTATPTNGAGTEGAGNPALVQVAQPSEPAVAAAAAIDGLL